MWVNERKKISTDNLLEMILAIKDVIAKYEGTRQTSRFSEPPEVSRCALCNYADELNVWSCNACPWVLFRGASCNVLMYKLTPIPKRLKRLNSWIKAIDKELQRRDSNVC